jgi:hypothetical protein
MDGGGLGMTDADLGIYSGIYIWHIYSLSDWYVFPIA